MCLKNPNKFFNTNIFINNKLYKNKEDDMLATDHQQLHHLHSRSQIQTSWCHNKFAAHQKQLNIYKCHEIQQVLTKYGKLFNGSLGISPHQKVRIDLFPGLKVVHHKAYYPELCAYEKTFKRNSNTWLILESWRMQCLWVGLALLHCCQKRWPGQKNLWPLFSQQMHQAQTISSRCNPQYYAMDLWIIVLYKTSHLDVILHILTWWRVPRAVCDHHTFWQIQI